MSEHQFKIKAILDSQQVQQEIQKLKQQATSAPGPNGAVGSQNAFVSTIEKLNSTIASLQKTIQGLIQSNKTTKISSQPALLAPSKSQTIPPIALSHVNGGSGNNYGRYVQSFLERQVSKAVLDAALNNPESLVNQQSSGWKGIFGGLKGSPAQQQAFKRLFDGVIATDIVRNGKLTPEAQDYFKPYLPKPPPPPPPKFLSWQTPNFLPSQSRKPSQQFMQGVSLMAGSYILGGLSNLGSGQTWEESPVSKGIGAVAGAASSGMMAGGAAAMMGLGPVGIGLAAIVPVVQELSKAIGEIESEKILAVASALQRANSAWEDIYEDFQKWDFSQFKEKISSLDLNNLTGERASARTQYQSDKAEYDTFMSSWASKMSKLDSQYFSGKITADQYALGKEDLNNERAALKEALQKSKDRLDAVNAVYDDHKKALEDFNNVVKQAADFEKSLAEFDVEQTTKDILKTEDPEKIKNLMPAIRADIDKANAAMSPIRSQGGLAEYEKETNKYRERLLTTEYGTAEYDSLTEIIKAREEAAKSYKEAAADMMKAVVKSKNLETTIDQLIKQMEDIGRNIKAQQKEVAEYDENARNRYDQRWGNLSKDQLDASSQKYWSAASGFKKEYEEALKKASLAKTPEEAKMAMDEAADAKNNWQFNQQQAQSFDQSIVGMLQEKLSDLKAPDMTQVNSLAQNGYMINKNDDEIRWKMQTDYASQQTQLQREIRDRLQSMDNSATFQ